MRRTLLLLIAALSLAQVGCSGTREALFDSGFDTFWEAGTDLFFGNRLTEDDKYIAKRKGMTDDQYKSLKREEKRLEEFGD
jgi:hypothetical protein